MAAKEKIYVTRYGNHKVAVPTEDGKHTTVRFQGQVLRTSDRAVQKHIESLPDYGIAITEFEVPKTEPDGDGAGDNGGE